MEKKKTFWNASQPTYFRCLMEENMNQALEVILIFIDYIDNLNIKPK